MTQTKEKRAAELRGCRGCGRVRKSRRPFCRTCSCRYWTHDRILAAFRDWAHAHGRPPRAMEWVLATPATPNAKTVMRRFGSWNAAVASAGFAPIRGYGGPGRRFKAAP